MVLKTFNPNNTDTTDQPLPPWVCTVIQVMGEIFDNLDNNTGGKRGKLLQICTTKIGLFLQTRPKMLSYAVLSYTETSFICSLSQLYVYFSALKPDFLFTEIPKRPRTKEIFTFDATVRKLSESLSEIINKKVLNAKQALPITTLRQLGNFLEKISIADWKNDGEVISTAEGSGLEAGALRAMKKSPEGSSAIIAAVLSRVEVDLSSFVKNGAAAAVLRIMKTPNAEVRESGMKIIRNLALKCSDSDAFESMVKVFTEALQGKGPAALVQPYQRLSVYVALSDCADGARVMSLGTVHLFFLSFFSNLVDFIVCDLYVIEHYMKFSLWSSYFSFYFLNKNLIIYVNRKICYF